MEDLHAALQQHVQLAVLDGVEAVVVERMSASKALGLVSQVGGRLPLHSSGAGKVLLAHGGESLFQQAIAEGLKAYISATISDPEQLRSDLGEYRRTRFALVNQVTSPDQQSVATAVFDASGECVAALSVVVAAGTVNLNSVAPAVLTAGRGISRGLGAAMPLHRP